MLGPTNSQEYVSQQYASHANDDEFEVDDGGEGLVDAPKRRSSNYNAEEDVLLCRTCCKVGFDLATGMDQTKETYWTRIKELYDKSCNSGCERTDRSLCSRWYTINTCYSKWSVVLASVGKNDKDRVIQLFCEYMFCSMCILICSPCLICSPFLLM
jgi:hypothetical protein